MIQTGPCGLNDSRTYPRIKEAIGEIDEKIEHQDQPGKDQGDTEYQRVVPIERGLDKIASDARQLEYLLDNHGAGQQPRRQGPDAAPGKTCRTSTRDAGSPLARAVRTWGACKASSTDPRHRRAMAAL